MKDTNSHFLRPRQFRIEWCRKMEKTIFTQLKDEGIKYVRWAFAGSYDEGGIVEVKLFDFKEQPVREISIYDCTSDDASLDGKILKVGEEFLDKIRGFEVDDGGYGWFLLDAESRRFTTLQNYNERGIDAEFFDYAGFDRVEIISYDSWSAEDSDLDCVDVRVIYIEPEKEIILNNEQKNKFLTFTRCPGKGKRKNFFDAGGYILCNLNGKHLRNLLVDMGLPTNEKLYYWADSVKDGECMSRTPDDVLDEIILKIYSRYQDTLSTIFISGWSEMFDYNVKDEASVIEEDPSPIEIKKMKSKET